MPEDYNRQGEVERRRRQFAKWLVRVWEWAGETDRDELEEKVAELLAHADESDYPLWGMAQRIGILRESALVESPLALAVRNACGIPVGSARANEWEREINFSPIIRLEEKTWERIYEALGWSNRNTDPKLPVRNFWLWSNGGNIVRFLVKQPVVVEDDNAVG